jgi:two-component system response regulator AtoC
MINRWVVLGSDASLLTELQQPAARLAHRAQTARAPVPRPAAPAQPEPVPVAVQAGAGDGSVGTAAPATASAPKCVSLKDISRTAARAAERELILRTLTRTHWSRKEAAEILGVSYKALLYKIKESGLDKTL